MIYLPSRYSAPAPDVRGERFRAACQVAAEMLKAGMSVFSPIAHSHAIAEQGDARDTWEFWRRVDLEFLARCDELVVLKLDGWRHSRGVQAEVATARKLGKPVSYIAPGDVTRRRPAGDATEGTW